MTVPKHRTTDWLVLSAGLLTIYLGFFHFCLESSPTSCLLAGVVCWLIWLTVCHRFRSVYLNRFEYLIHQVVGFDILLEGFNPFHDGYGFYYCAISFWIVLIAYRAILLLRNSHTAPGIPSIHGG